MLKLHGKLPVLNAVTTDSYLVTVTKSANLPQVIRERRALIRQSVEDGNGYKAVLTKELQDHEHITGSDVFKISDDHDYLQEGDIIRLDPVTGSFRCLYRKNSHNNSILLTEQCDHYCLMCKSTVWNLQS